SFRPSSPFESAEPRCAARESQSSCSSFLRAKAINAAVIRADDKSSIGNCWGTLHWLAYFVAPDFLAGRKAKHVNAAVIRPDNNFVARHGGRTVHFGPSRKAPDLLPVFAVHTMQL